MSQDIQLNELYFSDIWMAIKRYKRILLGVPLVCAIASYIYIIFFITPQWEASAILQVGQIGQSSKLVEPTTNAIARMLSLSFATEVLSHANIKSEELEATKNIFENSFKVAKHKDADLIELKLKGNSPDAARALAISAVSNLQNVHSNLMASSIDNLKAQINNVNNDYEELKSKTDFVSKLMAKHSGSANTALAAMVWQENYKMLRELKSKKLLLDEQLSPSNTFSTRLMGDISVTPVAIKKSFIITVATLVGLIGGFFIAFVRSIVNVNSV